MWVALFFVVEHALRYLSTFTVDWHPILRDENNRHVMSRHFGVDFFACLMVSMYGVSARKWIAPFLSSNSKVPADYQNRFYTYVPEGQRILTVFLAYQVKNLYDAIVWSDGPEFCAHHVVSGIAAWGAMYPGLGHCYAIFYMGVSELSTMVLVVLANFDDTGHGVAGLAEAFPGAKIFWAAVFVVFFVICRCVMWPIVSYYFIVDALAALKNEEDKKAKKYPLRLWFYAWIFILGSLTLLQFVWLGQIVYMGKAEIDKMMAA